MPEHNRAPELYEAVGRALTTWSWLEHKLAEVFCNSIGRSLYNTPVESAFWAVVSFDGKREMTDAVVRESFRHVSAIATEWNALNNRLIMKNRQRNKLAHGTVISLGQAQVGRTIHKADCYFAPYHWPNSLAVPTLEQLSDPKFETRPRDRMYVRDIREMEEGFKKTTQRLHDMSKLIEAHWRRRKRRLEHVVDKKLKRPVHGRRRAKVT